MSGARKCFLYNITSLLCLPARSEATCDTTPTLRSLVRQRLSSHIAWAGRASQRRRTGGSSRSRTVVAARAQELGVLGTPMAFICNANSYPPPSDSALACGTSRTLSSPPHPLSDGLGAQSKCVFGLSALLVRSSGYDDVGGSCQGKSVEGCKVLPPRLTASRAAVASRARSMAHLADHRGRVRALAGAVCRDERLWGLQVRAPRARVGG